MALTDIETIYAKSVDLIGEISLTDASVHTIKPYSTCALHYEDARDEMLSGYAWNIATELALCLESSITPPHTFQYKFALPDDCLRALHTTKPRKDWRIMGNFAYTNYTISPANYTVGNEYKVGQYLSYSDITYKINTAFTATVWTTDVNYLTTQGGDYGYVEIEYIKSLTDPDDWPVDLRHAIILNLASKIVIPITSDQKRRTALLEELHQLVLPHALAIDAMAGKPKQMFYSDYTNSRE